MSTSNNCLVEPRESSKSFERSNESQDRIVNHINSHLEGLELLKAVQNQKDLMDAMAREKRLQKQLEEEKEQQAKMERIKQRLAEFDNRAAQRKVQEEKLDSLQSSSCPSQLYSKFETRPHSRRVSKSHSQPNSLSQNSDMSQKQPPRYTTSSHSQQKESSEKKQTCQNSRKDETLLKKARNFQTKALSAKIRQTIASNPPLPSTPTPTQDDQRSVPQRKKGPSPRNHFHAHYQKKEQRNYYENLEAQYVYYVPVFTGYEDPYQNWSLPCYPSQMNGYGSGYVYEDGYGYQYPNSWSLNQST
jgi:hypothetical protein